MAFYFFNNFTIQIFYIHFFVCIKSDYCIIYYNEDCLPQDRKSGTKIALDYAIQRGKKIKAVNVK